MANRALKMRQVLAWALVVAMIGAMPIASYADHKKHFREGLRLEENKQWDKAAEKFALAVAEKPSNIEYQLHFHRSLVNAGLMLVERGDMLAEQKDYNAAFQAYRQAYAFDPANDLARIKMRRMLEVQGLPTDSVPGEGNVAEPRYRPGSGTTQKTSHQTPGAATQSVTTWSNRVQLPGMPPPRKQVKTDVIARSDNLLSFIEQLAQSMGLNVVFDQSAQQQMRNAKLVVELRNVTRPKALEIILKTNNLMYTQIDSRTIVIAMDTPASRTRYEPYAVRVFYIKNSDATEVRNAINATLQTKFMNPIKQLNALLVRDTPTNLQLVEALIESLDKAKAEVLIDVNIYEVSRNDLLSIGNQFATPDQQKDVGLTPQFLGGAGQNLGVTQAARAHTFINSTVLGFALGLPTSALSFFQDKGKAKLLASTQVHVLDKEEQSIRIGQRVPIQTAAFPTYTSGVVNPRQQRQIEQATGLSQTDVNPGLGGFFSGFGSGAFPQIQYENVGLNIDMKPEVYEDEVQLKMKIESTSLDTSTGKLTPSFNQRTMQSMARVKDGQPTLIAAVSQTNQSKTVKGFPIIGLIPILGRFFATPDTVDRQSDVVITVTPHILRRADITERDHLAWAAGYQMDPSAQLTIEQILYLADVEEAQQTQVAGAGGAAAEPPKTPPAESKTVLTSSPPTPASPERTGVVVINDRPVASPSPPVTPAQPPRPQPQVIRETVSRPGETTPPPRRNQILDEEEEEEADPGAAPVVVSVKSASVVAVRGQDLYVAIIANGSAEIASTSLSISYDPNIIEVKGVRDGGLLRAGGANPELQFTAEGGVLSVQLSRPPGSPGVPARGQLLLIVFNVKGQGQSPIALNEGQTVFRSSTGQVVPVSLQSTQIEAR